MGLETELLQFNLSDYDDEQESHCQIDVTLEKLFVSIAWQLEINEDYLDDDENHSPEGYSFDLGRLVILPPF